MTDNSVVFYLFAMTFAAVLIYGLVQLYKVNKAKKNNTHSAISARQQGPDTVKSDAPPKR